MAERILLVNPIKKVSKHSPTRKRKNTVKKRTRRAVKRTTRTIKRRNPIGAKTMAKRRSRRVHKRANPIIKARVHRKRRRHNPISMAGVRRRVSRRAGQAGGMMNHIVMPALTAAAGAIILDLGWANLPLPASVKTGNMQYLAKAAGAIALVTVAHKITKNKKQAEAMGVGALTVLLHDVVRNTLKKSMPGLHLGEYVGAGDMLDYSSPLGFYNTAGQGANTVPNFADPRGSVALPAGAVHTDGEMHGYADMYDGGMGEYVGEYV